MIAESKDPAAKLRDLGDEAVIQALAQSARERDPYLANVLATEALNRLLRKSVIVDTAGEGLMAMDADGRLLSMNPAAERFLGVREGDLRGKPMHELLHDPADEGTREPGSACPLCRIVATGERARGVISSFVRADGSTFPVEVSVQPVERDDQVVSFVVTFMDLTQRRRANEYQRRLAAIVESTDDAVLLEKSDGTILAWSPGAERLFGYPAEEMIGSSVERLLPPDRADEVAGADPRHARGERVPPFETERLRRDGSLAPVSLSLAPVRDHDGSLLGICSIYRDITDRRVAEAEKELLLDEVEAERRRLRDILEQMPVGVTIAEAPSGRITFHNAEAVRLLRHPLLESEDFGGYARYGARHADGTPYEAHEHPLTRALLSGEPVRDELVTYERGDGSLTRLLASAGAIRDAGGRIVAAVATFHDVSERLAQEEALRRSEARFRALYEHSPAMYFLLDPEMRVASANPHGARRLGFTPDEMKGRHILELFHADDREEAARHLEDAVQRRAAGEADPVVVWEGRKLPARGPPLFAQESAIAIPGENGENLILIHCHDLTERRRAEEEHAKAKAAVSNILERITDAFFAVDGEWRFTYVNEEAARVLERSREELLGRNIWSEFPEVVDSPFHEAYHRAVAQKVPTHVEAYYEPRAMWFEVRAYPDARGEGLSVYFRDITPRRRDEADLRAHRDALEERVAERTRELEAAYQELEAFSYSVSHDLRAPLRGIDYFTAALEEDYGDRLDDYGRELVARTRSESRRLTTLVTDLLALSRAARVELRSERVDLGELARQIASDLDRADPTRRVDWIVASGLSARGDPDLLRIVLENLLENAWKYTGSKALPRIELGVVRGEDEDSFFVRDNGVGFEPSQAGRLFEPFERLHADREFKGTGVGLATVRRVVERHGGHVRAEGRPGEGATFWFSLPISKSDGNAARGS